MKRLWPLYADKRYAEVLRKLRVKIAASKLALWAEIIAVRFWPFSTFVLFIYAFAAFGGLSILPASMLVWVLGGVISIAIALLGLGLYRFSLPSTKAAIDRLDGDMAWNPLASLRDNPASKTQDPVTRALWDRHQQNMATRAVHAQVPALDVRLSKRDPYGLRLMAVIAAVSAFLFAPADTAANLRAALLQTSGELPVGVSYEAWVNPPEYTGIPAIYLQEVPAGERLSVPTGSEVVVRVYGLAEDVRLTETVSGGDTMFSEDQTSLKAVTFQIVQSGVVGVYDGSDVMAEWDVLAQPDTSPTTRASEDSSRDEAGAFHLPYTTTDDYGVVGGHAIVTLDLDRIQRQHGLRADPVSNSPISIDLTPPFSSEESAFTEDFSKHVWAGQPVIITLSVEDAAGQLGTSPPIHTELFSRRFFVPLAAAIIEQRRDILWSPENDLRVSQVLRAISYLPEDFGLSAGSYLMLRTAIRRFDTLYENDLSDADREDAAEMLWELALQLEEGDLNDAAARLARARDKLLQAIEEEADKDEIASLMDELRAATEDYLEMLAQNAQPEDSEQAENQPLMDGADAMEQLLNELQQMAENGDQDAARELLDLMQEMMDNMQMAEQSGQGGMAQQMQEMQDALRQQQSLSDDTFEELQNQLESGAEELEGAEGLAERQEALRELLEALQGQMSNQETEEALDGAGENMSRAERELGNSNAGRALDQQAEAIENLREGIRKLSEDMQRAGQGRDGTEQGEALNDALKTDPLGRPLGSEGTSETGEQILPSETDTGRAQELMDEIRRRSGEQTRPEVEREYLERLLDGF